MRDNAGYEQVDAVDEHLADELFGNVEEPNPPWAFRRFSMSLVDEREDDEETEETLDYLLCHECVRPRRGGGGDLYARERLDRGDGKSVCRCRGSRRGLHLQGMRVVVEMAFDASQPNQTQVSLPAARCSAVRVRYGTLTAELSVSFPAVIKR